MIEKVKKIVSRQESNEVLSQKISPQPFTSISIPHLTVSSTPQSSITGRSKIFPVIEGIQSPKTRSTYQRCFDHFLKHIKISDPQVLLDFSMKVIKQILVDYILYLRDVKNLSRASIKVYLSAILHFFQINNDEFTLTIRNFKIYMPPDEAVQEDRPYTRDEIVQILNECGGDLRNRLIILLLSSTGMRMGAIHSLKVGHLTEIEFKKSILYKVDVYAGTRDKYYVFCNFECYDAIQNYLNSRKRSGEQIHSGSPLIREQFNKDNPFTINAPRFLSEKGIEHLIENILKRSGARNKEVHLSHGFRKFFMTSCEKSGMKSINVKMLMGHNIGVSGHYYEPSESDLLEDYLIHGSNQLTMDPTKRLQTRVKELETGQAQEIAQIKSRYDTLEAKYKQEHEEWGTLKDQVNELRRMFSAIDNESLKRKTFDNMYQEVGAVVLDQCNNSGSVYQDDGVGLYNSDAYKQWARQQSDSTRSSTRHKIRSEVKS
jgi:integrase